ncbi:MAG: phosphoribosylformylglycinamidine synthase subunit PurQ, partial [Candidatus Methylomirabilales bacterium]
EGRYHADPETLRRLNGEGRVLFRYCAPDGTLPPEANPNGSLEHIAGVCNARGNVLGLMPHPERAAEGVLGSEDGRLLFEGLLARALG